MDIKEIEIPIFLHPHLFWIFFRRDTKKRLQLQNDLAKHYSNSQPKDDDSEIGEIVVVKKNFTWKRAKIEKVAQEVKEDKFEIWLIDYGYLDHTSTVYPLKPDFQLDTLPPLVSQACLWNVVFLNEDFNIENNSIDQHKNTVPNAGATLNALQFMSDYQLFFKRSKELNGIFFGDILFKREGETCSLIAALIEKKLMVEDKDLFSKVESSRTNNKTLHLVALRQASKKHEDDRFSFDLSLLLDEVFLRSTSRGISLVDNGQSLTHESNSSQNRPTKSELLRNLRKKVDKRKMAALSCTESEIEEIKEHERNPTLNPNKQLSKAMTLKNLLNRKRSGQEVAEQVSIEGVTSGSEASDISLASKLAAMRLRSRTNKEKENIHNEDLNGQSKDAATVSKVLQSPRAVFLPGGKREITKKKDKPSRTSPNSKDTTKVSNSLKELNSNCESDQPSEGPNSEGTNKTRCSLSKIEMMKKLAANKKLLRKSMEYSDTDMSNMESSKESSVVEEADRVQIKRSSEENKIQCNADAASNSSSKEEQSKEGEDSNKDLDSDYTPERAVDSRMVVKPSCTCSECVFWTTSEDWRIGSERFTEEGKCKRKKLRPPSLMLKEGRKEEVKLASIKYNFMTKIEKDASFKILVHGRLLPQPIYRIVEAPFHTSIHRSLKSLKYVQTKKIQSYIWPAISRSMHVCLIHKKQSGKTLAYLPPLCSFLLEKEERYQDLKKGGPITIILGKSSTECEDIFVLANKLIGGGHLRPKIVLVTYPNQHVNLSSVDMLITIPPILIHLLKRNATNLKRLYHLVLENIDVLLEKYSEEMNAVILSTEGMLLQRSTRQGVQMIMTGEHWTIKLEKFIFKLRDIPLICIGDYLEASIYGGIKLKVKVLEAKAKSDAVVDILRDQWKYHKSIIICDSNEEIAQLKTSLDLASISYIAITDDLPIEEILQKESNWDMHTAGDFVALICTDTVLHTMLSITSASFIVHFSLPSKWSFWVKRFYCLLENYRSPLTKNNDKLKCEAYILTDELCVDQIPRLLSLLKNYNVSLQQFEPFCKQIEIQKEEFKIESKVPLCISLKKFGSCHTVNCPKRHLLDNNLDINKTLPQNGTIKYKILETLDVNNLKVEILEHKDISGNVTKYKSQRGLLDEKLTSLLNESKIVAENIVKNSCYAYWDQEDFDEIFKECIVEGIQSDKVDIFVKCDKSRKTVSKNSIYQLPEEFDGDIGTDIIIANFKPPYGDEAFAVRAHAALQSHIQRLAYNDDENIFVSNICLQLGDTIWVNTVHEEVTVFEKTLTKSNINKDLVRYQWAERNQEHMDNLYELCEEAGIVLPKYTIPIEQIIIREPPQPTPQWAHLEMNECNRVYFSSAVTPDEMYLRLEKFDSLLQPLEKELYEVAIRQGSESDMLIIPGRYYMAKDPMEDKYIRVQAKKTENDQVLCYAVDYGDEFVVPLSNIRYLSNRLIEILPFQAIHCRLFGIKSVEEDWPCDVVDVLYKNFTFEGDSDIFKTLYAECILYERGMHKNQSFFSILLKDVFEKPILINQLLIDCGWAKLIEGSTLEDFDVEFSNYLTDEDEESKSDDEVDKVKDILETAKSISSNNIVPKTLNSTNRSKGVAVNVNELEFFSCGPGDETANFVEFMNAMKQNSEKETSAPTQNQNNLPAIEAAPFEVDYCTPDVYWSQTKKNINMFIKLPNVKTYNVKVVKSRIFNLETTVDEKKYVVNLVLYESVEKTFNHKLGGLEIKITLTKKKEEEWPKLARSKDRLRNVHYLISSEEMEDEENNGKLFLDLGEEFKTECDSDDNVYFDVFSDEDSEYEQEIPEDLDCL